MFWRPDVGPLGVMEHVRLRSRFVSGTRVGFPGPAMAAAGSAMSDEERALAEAREARVRPERGPPPGAYI